MKGRIVSFIRGEGRIRGDDGRDYRFQPADLIQPQADLVGIRQVDFIPDGDRARQILVLETGPSSAQIETRDAEGRRVRHARAAPLDTIFGYAATGLSQRYFSFRGRARRKEYFSIIMVSWLLVLCPLVLQAALGGHAPNITAFLDGSGKASDMPLAIVSYVALLLLVIPNVSAAVRRLHDTGRSGWLWCISFLPYIGSLIVLVLMLLPGQKGTNAYGPAPER